MGCGIGLDGSDFPVRRDGAAGSGVVVGLCSAQLDPL